jgi:BirA family biotin operon repressor/biotin-[acetyl-CoA-carboxylase] ligase
MIAGIGLNVNQVTFSPDIPNPASLKGITGNHYDLNTLLDNLLTNLDYRYDQLRSGKGIRIHDEYQQRMYRFGEWHPYLIHGVKHEAIIKGITSHGQLVLESREGNQWYCDVKEVVYQ